MDVCHSPVSEIITGDFNCKVKQISAVTAAMGILHIAFNLCYRCLYFVFILILGCVGDIRRKWPVNLILLILVVRYFNICLNAFLYKC